MSTPTASKIDATPCGARDRRDDNRLMPFVSVVIPTFRRPEETALAIKSVAQSDYPVDRFEIIVVDTSPDDLTRNAIAAIEADFPRLIRFIPKKTAEGPGDSRNYGIAQARGEILAFTDSDCIVVPSWLSEGVRLFADQPRLGIVQGRVLPNPAHPRGAASRFVQADGPNCVFHACNVFFRREAFDAVSGFSPEFNFRSSDTPAKNSSLFGRLLGAASAVHYNALLGFDIDLAWRVLERGWASAYRDAALVYHAVTPLTRWQWVIEGAYYAYSGPPMVKRHPGLRRYMFAGLFASKTTALFDLFCVSLLLSLSVHWVAAVFCLPYIFHRGAEPSRVWRGILKLFRFLVYLPRDLMTMLFYLVSSVRHRTIVI